MEERRRSLRCVGEFLVVLFTVIAGLSALGIWIFPDFDPFGWKQKAKEGEFVDPGNKLNFHRFDAAVISLVAQRQQNSRFDPWGYQVPTIVSFPNKGGGQCLIQGAEFRLKMRLRTPPRETRAGEAISAPVNFRAHHYDKEKHRFRLRLKEPCAVPPGEWVSLKVAIIAPEWVGNTYIGDLTVFYNHNKRITLEGVELDVLKQLPCRSEQEGV